MEEVKEQNKPPSDGGPPATEELASNIVKGTAAELDKPETREQFGRIIETATRSAVQGALGEFTNSRGGERWGGSAQGFQMGPPGASSSRLATGPLGPIGPIGMLGGKMAEGFTLGMSRQLQVELGPNGEGPLGQTMAGVMRQATQAAISGATHELAPADCAGLDGRECADRRVRDLSRSAAKGFVDGLGNALQIPLLIGAFLAGVVGALVVFLLMRLRRPVLIATDAGQIHRQPQPHGT
jgi:hypothetical protein